MPEIAVAVWRPLISCSMPATIPSVALPESSTIRRWNCADVAARVPASWEAGTLAATSAQFHRRMVELSGNATLGIVAGMLQEISGRHTATAISGIPDNKIPRAEYTKLYKSYVKLADLVEARRGDAAETHWRRHMEAAGAAMLKGHEKTRVRDIMD